MTPRGSLIALAIVAVPALAAAAPASGQSADDRNRALIVLDGSKSMNEDAGNGGTRLDAAKQAVGTLLDRLPAGVPLGLRVYGAKVAETSREEACKDTELVVPVGPLDKEALRSRVQALTGKGRTPIGDSLLAVGDDFGAAEGRRTVILVSDGGDNCAPPDPCKAAREVSKQGIDLSISVVGLQVNERVRRQLECIAKAGGGTYVDVQDADELADELAAALSRAFRSYEPAGTKVTGGPANRQPAVLQAGLFQDAIAPGETRWYAVDVPEGRRLLASVSAIPSYDDRGQSALRTELFDTELERLEGDAEVLYGRAAGAGGRVRTQSLSMPDFAGTQELPPGRYTFRVEIEDGIDADSRARRARRPAPATRRGARAHARVGAARADADAHAHSDTRTRSRRSRRRRRRGGRRRRPAGDRRGGRGGHRGRAARGARADPETPGVRLASARRRGGPLLAAAPAAAQDAAPVVGAGSFTSAPIIEPGTYRDTVLPEEYLYYGVRVAAGQRLRVRLQAGLTSRELADLGLAFVQVNLHGPDRARLFGISGRASTAGSGAERRRDRHQPGGHGRAGP